MTVWADIWGANAPQDEDFIQFHRVVLELSLENALNGYIRVVYELNKKDLVSRNSNLLDFLGE